MCKSLTITRKYEPKFGCNRYRLLLDNFGAYLVDDTAWDVYAIVTEWSPEGRFAEEFEKNWGFPINDSNKNTPWNRDMDKIYLNLHVVVNNGPDTPGGGGTPLMPLAPPFESHKD
jgi:hypothetical protein